MAVFREAFHLSESKAVQSGKRSTALTTLQWTLAIAFGGLSSCLLANGPGWLVVTLAIFAAAAFLNIIAAFWYFALKDPDMLRSEGYSLHKIALEKGYQGDSVSGLTLPATDGRLMLPPSHEEGKP